MSCNAERESSVTANLRINGKIVELNDFVKEFIAQTIIGMVKSLKGVSDIKTIDLKISKKRK